MSLFRSVHPRPLVFEPRSHGAPGTRLYFEPDGRAKSAN
jgi:hypothetical protein